MTRQATIRVQIPGQAAVRIGGAALIDRNKNHTVGEFSAVSDYEVTLDLATVTPGDYRLSLFVSDYPVLYFPVRIGGEAKRTFEFARPQPACVTITFQEINTGSATRTVHAITFALPKKPEVVVMLAGADLKGATGYLASAKTWRDDLYHGRTDIGDQPGQSIPQTIHDHTLVTMFDFRTGMREEQLKAVRGWYTMTSEMQGNEPPDLAHPHHEKALKRRQEADSISIVHVYDYLSRLGVGSPGCVRELHFFAHAYLRGPILQNTSDHSDTDARDPTDKDCRTKDLLPVNLARYGSLPDAFSSTSYVKIWGCFNDVIRERLAKVARTKSREEVVQIEGEPYTSEDVIREMRMHLFPENYMLALCRTLGVDGWAAAPGTTSSYKKGMAPRHYFFVDERYHGAIIGWYERFFDCKRDIAGYVSYRKLL